MKAKVGSYIKVTNGNNNQHLKPFEGKTGTVKHIYKNGIDTETIYCPEKVYRVNLDSGHSIYLCKEQFVVVN